MQDLSPKNLTLESVPGVSFLRNGVKETDKEVRFYLLAPGVLRKDIKVGYYQDKEARNKTLYVEASFFRSLIGTVDNQETEGQGVLNLLRGKVELDLERYNVGNIFNPMDWDDINHKTTLHDDIPRVHTHLKDGIFTVVIRKGPEINLKGKPCGCEKKCLCVSHWGKDFWLTQNLTFDRETILRTVNTLNYALSLDAEAVSTLFKTTAPSKDTSMNLTGPSSTRGKLTVLDLINSIVGLDSKFDTFVEAIWSADGKKILRFAEKR